MILIRIPPILSSSQTLVLADYNNTFKDIRLSIIEIIFFEILYYGSEAAVYSI